MNRSMVRYTLGRILCIVALLMAPSLIIALIYNEGWQGLWPFLLSITLTGGFGFLISIKRPQNADYFAREGFIIVALSWIALSFFGSLPFIFSGAIANPIDAFFEASSGFTTTGASIITDIESIPNSILWWRSFTHLIGGMGVLVFALAVLPKVESNDVHVMKAEVPGPTFGKIRSRLRNTAQILYIIYLSITAVLVMLLALGGMSLFDSFLHAFGAAGTGGFGIKSNSIAYYNSAYIDYVLGVAMLVFGVNFNLYYALLIRNFKSFFKSEELRWYLSIIFIAIAAICLNISDLYSSVWQLVRDVFFSVSSIITTTGYTTANFDSWPIFSKTILLLIMFVGGMAGSTAGGLKVSRIVIYVKTAINEVRQFVSPNRRLAVKLENKPLNNNLYRQTYRYLITYLIVFVVILLVVALNSQTFETAFSAVVATFNNIGPGLGAVGPTGSYSPFNNITTFVLSIGMIMGRLELFPILILLSPRTWKKR